MTDTFLPGIRLTDGVEPDYDEALGMFPGHTLVVGDSQVTLMRVPGEPDWLYIINTITRPGKRRQHGAQDLYDRLLEMADENGVTLVTHPDEPWMVRRLIDVRGFEHDDSQPTWDGKPFLLRRPRPSDLT